MSSTFANRPTSLFPCSIFPLLILTSILTMCLWFCTHLRSSGKHMIVKIHVLEQEVRNFSFYENQRRNRKNGQRSMPILYCTSSPILKETSPPPAPFLFIPSHDEWALKASNPPMPGVKELHSEYPATLDRAFRGTQCNVHLFSCVLLQRIRFSLSLSISLSAPSSSGHEPWG